MYSHDTHTEEGNIKFGDMSKLEVFWRIDWVALRTQNTVRSHGWYSPNSPGTLIYSGLKHHVSSLLQQTRPCQIKLLFMHRDIHKMNLLPSLEFCMYSLHTHTSGQTISGFKKHSLPEVWTMISEVSLIKPTEIIPVCAWHRGVLQKYSLSFLGQKQGRNPCHIQFYGWEENWKFLHLSSEKKLGHKREAF